MSEERFRSDWFSEPNWELIPQQWMHIVGWVESSVVREHWDLPERERH